MQCSPSRSGDKRESRRGQTLSGSDLEMVLCRPAGGKALCRLFRQCTHAAEHCRFFLAADKHNDLKDQQTYIADQRSDQAAYLASHHAGVESCADVVQRMDGNGNEKRQHIIESCRAFTGQLAEFIPA